MGIIKGQDLRWRNEELEAIVVWRRKRKDRYDSGPGAEKD